MCPVCTIFRKEAESHGVTDSKYKKDRPLKVIKTGIVSWLIVFLFWGLGSLQYDEIFLPSPAETWTAIKELVSNGTLWADIAASVNRVLKGWDWR